MPLQNVKTLGELRRAKLSSRSVKDEIRANLVRKLQAGEALFPGIIGYDDTVVPQLINAVLSRHNFILLGLRGQAKSRILRALVDLLDEEMPVVPGCEIHDDPLAPLCAACRTRAATEGDEMLITWLQREARYVEKLATPDVTIADMVGDIEPITTLELVVSNAERRALANGEDTVVPRVTDIYAALPSITGKFELEYEGELRGAETVARDLIRAAVGTVFTGVFDGVDTRTVVEWFDLGGTLQLSDGTSAEEVVSQTRRVQGLGELAE